MEIKEFIASLEKLNFSLSVDNGKLNLKGDKTKLSKDEIEAIKVNEYVIDYIKANKNELIEYLSGAPASSSIKKTKNISSIYRLSGLQEGMLFHSLYNKGEAYIEQVCCNISNVNILIFEKSWNNVLKQHSILRSAFYYDEFNVAVQAVHKEVALPLAVIDYTSLNGFARDLAIKEFENAQRLKGFEFKEPPLMRIGLLKLNESEYRLVWTSHHLLFDGWSMPVILEEFLTTYELLLAGKPIVAKEEDKYEDYIRYVERIDKGLSKDYWSGYLKDLQQSTLLPFVVNSSDRTKGEGEYKVLPLQIESATSIEIQNFAKKHRLTINTLVQGVWSLLLHNYAGSKNIVYGVIVSGRPEDFPGAEKRVGLYINTLPLYSSVSDNPIVLDWLQNLQNDQVKSRQHQYTALHEIKKWTGVQGDLFDSLLVFENYPVSKLVSANKWSLRFDSVKLHEHTNYPLTILVNSSDDIHIQFSYNSHLLSDFYVGEIQHHFKNVLLQLLNSPTSRITDIQLLTSTERNILINKFENNQLTWPADKTIITLIEEQVQKTPDQVAVIFENKQLAYRELNERSNQLGHYLLSKEVKKETLIPVCFERGLEMIVAILGILKAGCAYVPIDPKYPKERIAFMLEDTASTIIVTNTQCSQILSAFINLVDVIELDKIVLSEHPKVNLNTVISRHQLAYIIYTSGSTGKPKGVMIEHQNVCSFISWCQHEYASSDFNIVYASTSICFDLSVYEIFYPLSIGKQIRILENGLEISKFLSEDTKVLTNSVPAVIDNLIKEGVDLSNVSVINMAGEPVPIHLLQHLDTDRIEVRNLYGPTETTTYSTVYRLKKDHPILIGKPISNTQIFIVTANDHLAPVGVIGEINIGGAGVARGYLNRAELTAEKFIKNPFFEEEAARLYKTGDLGRYLPDGNIEYLGRADDQVKIRGYRIELGEIENVLQQSGLVAQSVVLAKQDTKGNKRLVGYVVSNGAFNSEEITNYLHSKLPDYMLPTQWVEVESMPQTSNGKIDKKALPDPGLITVHDDKYVEPASEIERKLADIWQEILGIDKVGIYDNFFELGGHSILAMQVISFVRRKLKLEASIKDLFLNPTIAAFSEILSTNNNFELQPTIKVVDPRPENIPLSFSQERLWFIDRFEGSVSYHIPAVFRLKGKLDLEALSYSIRKIVDRHEVLRTVIKEQDEEQYQQILVADDWNLNIHRSDSNRSNILSEKIHQIINQPFNLSKDYMLRADLITLNSSENILVVTMHHIASDGWSLSIIVKEVVELYQSYVQKRVAKLDQLPIQYADYSIWQRNYLQGQELEKKINYWKEKLREVSPLNLPISYQKPSFPSTAGDVEYFSIDKDLLEKIHSLGQKQGATLFMTLLAAFKILLYRYSGQEDICIGTPTANRTHREVEGLIGLFLNTLALHTDVRSEDSFLNVLAKVKKTTLEAYEHQDVPFEKVVEAVVKERDLSRSPLFQVMFILQNTPDIPTLQLGDVELISENFEDKTSKFELTFNVRETDNGLQGLVHYRTDLFAKFTIKSLLGHFFQLLRSIIEKPVEKAGSLSFLSFDETNKILREFNRPLPKNLAEHNLVNLFEEQVGKTPDNIALRFGDQSLSYDELNKRSNQLARFLSECDVKKGTIVSICIDRSFEMMIGIIAILKSGAAYVPIDPDYPVERISYMLNDTAARVVLTSASHANKLQAINGKFTLIALDSEWNRIEKRDDNNLHIKVSGEDLAYVLYTSGSTGKPKGVQIEHNSIAQHLKWFTHQYSITEQDSSLLVSSFSFDGALTAIWPVLTKGGSLHLPIQNELDPARVLEYISQHSITYLKTLPSIFGELIRADNFTDKNWCKSLRLIILGGEKIKTNDLKSFFSYYPDVIFSNHYGPTECTVSSSFFIIDKNNIDRLHAFSMIGKPVENTNIYVVNEEGLLNPIDVPGEIWISGVGVARGYLNSQELSKQKFIPNPFSNEQGTRVYKTGDVGRWLADGNLEFIGRKDEQVKIRGYRAELGEIEDALRQSALIREAIVVAKEDGISSTNLVAYVVADESFDSDSIVEFLKAKLPGFMIPSIWVKMENLPLSPNGKVDKKALPEPGTVEGVKNKYQPPRNKTEQAIADIWKELLRLKQVGVSDNFFEIGGHSLLAIRVISSIRKKLQTELSIKSIFLYPTVERLADYILKQEKGILLPSIEVEQRPDRIPLSFSQERLWFIDQLEGSTQFHLPTVLKLEGKLEVDALTYALREIVNRHEILRTVILENEGHGYQTILLPDSLQMAVIDGTKYKENQLALRAYIQQKIRAPFNLSKDSMMRAELIRMSEEEHVLLVTMHHIASDNWSKSIFVKEVVELYQSYREKRKSNLIPLILQYADYSIWQRNYLKDEILNQKLDYWKEKLKGVAKLELPTDSPRHLNKSKKGATTTFDINKGLRDCLNDVSRKHESTLFMTLLTAFKILLYKYSGLTDVCVGTSTAGRQQQEVENLIGLFVNLLALRTNLDKDESFASLLSKVKQTTLDAYENQEVPFEKVVDAVVNERDMSRSPIFQVMLVVLNNAEVPQIKLSGLTLTSFEHEHTSSNYDFTVFITETPAGLKGSVEYSVDLFNADTINRMMGHFTTILNSVALDQTVRIADVKMLSEAEYEHIAYEFNATEAAYSHDKSIVDLFEKQVAETPGATAIVFEKEKISYAELNARANAVAHYLRSKGVREEILVPIFVERSVEMIVGILGILKAGGAYVPIDIQYPVDRISFILDDTEATVVLSNKKHCSIFANFSKIDVLELDADSIASVENVSANLPERVRAHNLAYVIYTSGSTGKPKGVLVEHGNVISLVTGVNFVPLDRNKILLSTGSPAFDATTFEYWSMLLNGGQLVLCAESALLNPESLKSEIDSSKVNIMWFTSSWFNQLVDSAISVFESLEIILVGGEKLSEKHISRFRETYPSIKIINGYGPTENTTFSLTYTVTETAIKNTIPIGKPLSNRTAYVLDDEQHLSAIGVVGEIYVGGAGVARGYLKRPELTAERFVENPFAAGERLYKTGDLGKRLDDGNIEYVGRIDAQVKIRGYRIELGEIESVLQELEEVRHAVVIAKADGEGTKRLIAYVVPKGYFDKESIRLYLKSKIPDYMVPAILVQMEELPLTSNGKVDRKALPDPDMEAVSTNEFVAPRNQVEETLSNIWNELLDLELVGIHDNFFEIGGDSLLAIRVVSAIRKQLGVEISISTIFEYQTIALLATEIESQTKEAVLPAITTGVRPAKIPLSFSQQRLWFIDSLEGSLQYHLPEVLRLKGALNKEALEFAISGIINRHEVLRTTYLEENGEPYQVVKDKAQCELRIRDASAIQNDEVQLVNLIRQVISDPFNLSKDNMLRADLFTLNEQDHVLVVILHHIASDGWSRSIMVKEVAELYSAYESGRTPALPSLPIQYADFAIWQRNYLQGETLAQKLAYWKENLSGVEPVQIQTDFVRPAIQTSRGGNASFIFDKNATGGLRQISQKNGATLFMTLLTLLKVLLYRYTSSNDICVGTAIAGRQQQELEGLMGFFVNTLALRTAVNSEDTFVNVLNHVKQTTLNAYKYQDVPFEKVVDSVTIKRDRSRNPIFQIMCVLQNTPDVESLKLGSLERQALNYVHNTAQFDLSFSFIEHTDGIFGSVVYNSDLYLPETINRLVRHLHQLAQSAIKNQDTAISKLPMLSTEEKQYLLYDFNSTDAKFPQGKTIVNLFEEQVEKTPNLTAVVADKGQLTYRELNERSNQVAQLLLSKGVQPETLVPICIERSVEMIVGILGILKSGAAYVPIDPTHPEERIGFILQDTKAKIVLTSKASLKNFESSQVNDIIELDGDARDTIQSFSTDNVPSIAAPDCLAYVIYTSGSTGKPKGVMVEHRSYVNINNFYHSIEPGEQTVMTCNYVFDVSVLEIFSSLLAGGCLNIPSNSITTEPYAFAKFLHSKKISTAYIHPMFLREVSNGLNEYEDCYLKKILIGVEPIRKVEVEWYINNNINIINGYGPTETTVCATFYHVHEKQNNYSVLPIGKPVNNNKIFIVDNNGQLVPSGIAGEILIGGVGVARGYLNRDDLTKEKFIRDYFSDEPGARLYVSGDLGRLLPDGNIEYVGRKDEQVKINGYRIELEEIVTVLKESGLVKDVVVLARESAGGGKQLVGYVVADETFDKEEIKHHLNRKLPEYMVPRIWVQLNSMPLTSNGKIDKKLLPVPDVVGQSSSEFVSPENETEQKLSEIWQQLLGIENIGVNSNFFELGGNSLMIMRLKAQIHLKLKVELEITDLFQYSTIRELAKFLNIQPGNQPQQNLEEEFDLLII